MVIGKQCNSGNLRNCLPASTDRPTAVSFSVGLQVGATLFALVCLRFDAATVATSAGCRPSQGIWSPLLARSVRYVRCRLWPAYLVGGWIFSAALFAVSTRLHVDLFTLRTFRHFAALLVFSLSLPRVSTVLGALPAGRPGFGGVAAPGLTASLFALFAFYLCSICER